MKRALLAATLVLLAAAPSQADDVIAPTDGDGSLAGYGGWLAWSDQEPGSFRLKLRSPDGKITTAPVRSLGYPFTVSLGPDARGRIVAVYQRGDNIRQLDLLSGRDRVVVKGSNPAIWRSALVFTRTVGECERVYVLERNKVREISPRRPCLDGTTRSVAIRDTNVAISSFYEGDAEDESFLEDVRLYSTKRRTSKVLVRKSYSQETNHLGHVVIDQRFVTVTNYGLNTKPGFLRIPLRGGRPTRIGAHVPLAGPLAQISAGVFAYTQSQGTAPDEEAGEGSLATRVILGTPVSVAPHPLPPELEFDVDFEHGQATGRLVRRVFAGSRLVRTEPVAGIAVALRQRKAFEGFQYTPFKATTGPDGRFTIVVPHDRFETVAVAATPGCDTWSHSEP
jgi:hypothetical protein